MARASDVALYFGGTLLSQAITFVSGVFIARWLGPADYGVLSLARNVYAVAVILAPLGLDLSLLRHLGENENDWPRSITQIYAFRKLVLAVNVVAALAMSLLAAPWVEAHVYPHPHFALYLSLTFLALPFAADIAILSASLRALDKVIFQNLTGLYLQPVLRTAALALFLVLGFGVAGVLASTVVGVAASCLAMSLGLNWLVKKRGLKGHSFDLHDKTAIRKVFGYSGWLAVMLFIYNTLRNVDILVLGWYRPLKEVGEYAALSTIAYTIQIFPLAVSQTLGPAVARRYAQGDLEGVRHELSSYLRTAVLLSSPIFAGIAVFGPWLDLLFGARFTFDGRLSFALAVAYFISGALGQMGVSLTMTGRHKLEFCVLVVGGLATFGACLFAAPRFGPVGVACAIAAGYLFLNGVRTAISAVIMGGLDISIGHLAPPALCLAIAFAWRALVEHIAPRTLPVAFVAGPTLLVLFAIGYWTLLLRPQEKAKLTQKLAQLSSRFKRA